MSLEGNNSSSICYVTFLVYFLTLILLPHISRCCKGRCKGQQHGSNNRFKISSLLQLRTLPCVCAPLLCVCVYTLCVFSVYVCACIRVCPLWRILRALGCCLLGSSAKDRPARSTPWGKCDQRLDTKEAPAVRHEELSVEQVTPPRDPVFLLIFISERCLHFHPLKGRGSFCSTPSLALFSSTPNLVETQQQKHLHLHQRKCRSAAAAPTTQ